MIDQISSYSSTPFNKTTNKPLDQASLGVANGVAPLDGSAKIPATNLPSYVDDVLEFSSQGAFPGTGESGKIYVALDTNKVYRWSGSVYIEISPSPNILAQVLTGLVSTAQNVAITSSNTIIEAFGFLQGQITYILNKRGSVHIKDFGAVCDGVTNDSVAIQAAIEYGYTNNCAVDFGHGTVRATGLMGYENSIFIAAGFCIVKAPNGTNNDVFTFVKKGVSFSTATGSNNRNNAAYRFKMANILVDCNKANNTPSTIFNHTESSQGTNQATARGFGLKIYGFSYKLINVHVWNAPSVGIYSECGLAPGKGSYGNGYFDTECQMSNVKVHDSNIADIIWRGPNDSQLSNVIAGTFDGINHIVIEDNYTNPSNGTYGALGTQLTNFHTYGTCSGAGVLIRGYYSKLIASSLVFEGTDTVSNSSPAIRLESNGNIFSASQSYVGDIGIEVLSSENDFDFVGIGFTVSCIRLGKIGTQAAHNKIKFSARFCATGIEFINSDYNNLEGHMRADTGAYTSGTPGSNDAWDIYQVGGLGVLRKIRWPNLPTSKSGLDNNEIWNDNGVLKLGSAANGNVSLLFRQNTATIAPANPGNNALASFTIPAGIMGNNGTLRITFVISCDNNANTKTLQIYWGGATIYNQNLAGLSGLKHQREIANRNAANSQITWENSLNSFGSTTGAVIQATAVDTSINASLTLAMQKSNSADNVTLQYILVELLR